MHQREAASTFADAHPFLLSLERIICIHDCLRNYRQELREWIYIYTKLAIRQKYI